MTGTNVETARSLAAYGAQVVGAARDLNKAKAATSGWAAYRDIVFRSPRLPFLGRRTEEFGLSGRQSTDASDRAVDSRIVLVRTNDRLQHFRRRTC
jgi:hypothetical protein